MDELYQYERYKQFHIYVEETLGYGRMYQASAFYNGTFMFKSRMRLTAENAIRDVTLKIDEFWEDDLE